VPIASEYAIKDGRIQVHVNEKNLGDYPNRNKAVSYAKGEFLVFVDSDDTIYPDALAYIVQAFNEFPLADFATIVDAVEGMLQTPKLISSKEAIQQHFFTRGFLQRGPGGTVVRRRFFYSIGCFPERYGPANDMYYNIKAGSNSLVLLLPYHFLFYREHDGQENKNEFSYLYNTYIYYNDLMGLPELPLSNEQRKYLLLKSKRRFIVNLFKYYRRTKKTAEVLKAIRLAKFGFGDFMKGVFHL
jgi:glycosyltransferase involved in cell wall biosynthesis